MLRLSAASEQAGTAGAEDSDRGSSQREAHTVHPAIRRQKVEARPQLRVEAARQMAWRRVEAQRHDRSEHQRQHRGSHQTKNLIA